MRIPVDDYLETTRCLLRYPLMRDTERLLSAFTADAFPGDVPLGQITSVEQVRDWIEGCQRRWLDGISYTWTAERKSDREVIGQASVAEPGDPGVWSLAYWTHPDCWGQGYATEILQRIIDFAFETLGARCVWAAAATQNEASLRVLQKGGLHFLRTNPDGYRIHQRPIETYEYELTRAQWTPGILKTPRLP